MNGIIEQAIDFFAVLVGFVAVVPVSKYFFSILLRL
jgi:hypothetical protein